MRTTVGLDQNAGVQMRTDLFHFLKTYSALKEAVHVIAVVQNSQCKYPNFTVYVKVSKCTKSYYCINQDTTRSVAKPARHLVMHMQIFLRL